MWPFNGKKIRALEGRVSSLFDALYENTRRIDKLTNRINDMTVQGSETGWKNPATRKQVCSLVPGENCITVCLSNVTRDIFFFPKEKIEKVRMSHDGYNVVDGNLSEIIAINEATIPGYKEKMNSLILHNPHAFILTIKPNAHHIDLRLESSVHQNLTMYYKEV